MSSINVSSLTFAYEGSYDNIFEDVSFQIDTDWKLGFTGRNGKGKTTFLNLLMGKYEYIGKISASVAFQYFPYNVQDKSAITTAIVEEIAPEYQDWQLLRELSLLDVHEDVLHRPFETLSNGEQTKVLLAALFLSENSFLLIDEPTNHLDMGGRKIVSNYLKSKYGFILVSHDRAFLDGCVDHILSINKANIEVQKGNFSSWFSNKELQDNFERLQNVKLKKQISQLEKAARKNADLSDKMEALTPPPGNAKEKGIRLMSKSKAIETRIQRAVDEKNELLKNLDHASDLKIIQPHHHKSRFLSLSGVSIYYGEKNACNGISLDVNHGDRIVLHGKNGSGKSSILKLINGDEISYTGELTISSGLKISYVSQDTSFLQGNLTDYAQQHGIDESLFKAILRKLDFLRIQFEKDMKNFSGGQKKKVLIARSLCEKAHLLVWDEPLNFIDVMSRMQIERLLLEYKPTVLFVEHDRIFCDAIATGVVQL